jgi:hypothetical protein
MARIMEAEIMIVTRSEKRGGCWVTTRRYRLPAYPSRTRREVFYTREGVHSAINAWNGPIKVRIARRTRQ